MIESPVKKTTSSLAWGAILLAASAASVLIVIPMVDGVALTVRVALALALAALAGGGVWMLVRDRDRQRAALDRYTELLCCLDDEQAGNQLSPEALPALGENNVWFPLFRRVRDCIHHYHTRLADAEHARTSVEVRLRRLSQERQQMTEILAGLSSPVVAIDQYDELVVANPSAEQLLKLNLKAGESRALSQLTRCEELVNLLTETRRRKTQSHRTGEVTLHDETGTARSYRVTCTSLVAHGNDKAADGNAPRGAVAVLSDISDHKAIQKRNAEFVSAVSHEMKTPLAGIKAYVELLADGEAEDPQTREEFFQVINSQADRLQRLIDNLLNLARIEAGVVHVDKQRRPLNELLAEAFNVVQPAAEKKRIQLQNDLSPLYLEVLADRDMLLQAAINLLSNAIKYTPDGGTVTLRSRLQDREIVFEVEDTGVGLDEIDCQKVFEKFYRVKRNQQMAAGTGLGLPLAKHIVEEVHGGRLTVTSQLGKGSTFSVSLPSAGRLTS